MFPGLLNQNPTGPPGPRPLSFTSVIKIRFGTRIHQHASLKVSINLCEVALGALQHPLLARGTTFTTF